MNVGRAYESLLRLYPADHRARFAAQMLSDFHEAASERQREPRAFVRFALAEATALVAGAGAEWIAKLKYSLYHSNSYISGRCMPDLGLMRPPGVARASFYDLQSEFVKNGDLIDQGGLCVNVRQTLAVASPLKRLMVLACTLIFPIHQHGLNERSRANREHH
jgi:hypothetical protein